MLLDTPTVYQWSFLSPDSMRTLTTDSVPDRDEDSPNL